MSRFFMVGAYASHLLPGWTILYISKHTIPPCAGVEYVSLVGIHVLVVRFVAHPTHIFFFFFEITVLRERSQNCMNIIFRRVRKFAKSDYWFCHVRPYAWNNSAPTARIFVEILHLSIFLKSAEKIQVSLKSDKNNGYITWRPIYILIISR